MGRRPADVKDRVPGPMTAPSAAHPAQGSLTAARLLARAKANIGHKRSCQAFFRALQFALRYPPGTKGDFFRAGDAEALAGFQRANEFGRLQQRLRRAGVEPGVAAPHAFDGQLPALEIDAVQVGDFQLAARRRLQPGGDVRRLSVVEIEPGDGPMRSRPRGFSSMEVARPAASNETTP